MSALQDAIDRVTSEVPIVEFACGNDWLQVDPLNKAFRWRPSQADWEKWFPLKAVGIAKYLKIRSIRVVPRAEADDWRSRYGESPRPEAPVTQQECP